MDISRIKDLLFRHVEKIVLAVAVLFVGYQVCLNLFTRELEQPGRGGTTPVGAPKPSEAIDASFREAAAPFTIIAPVERAHYNWFYPPDTRWGARLVLVVGDDSPERRSVGGKAIGQPIATRLTDEERKEAGLPAPPEDFTEPCVIKVTLERGKAKDPPGGDVLVIEAVRPGYWVRVMVTLENQDRYCVPVLVNKKGVGLRSTLAVAYDLEVKEQPLGIVAIRFKSPHGSVSSTDGSTVTSYVEPDYYEVVRRGEHEKAERVIRKLPGRTFKSGDAPTATEPKVVPKGPDSAGFPGAKAGPSPKKKEGPPSSKGEPAKDIAEISLEDRKTEAEVEYTYRIRSVPVLREDSEFKKPKDSDPVVYKTLPRFSFAYIGGDASRATIRVYIGPRGKTPGKKDKQKEFDRIPIGGWVGDVPEEFTRGEGAPDAKEAEPAAVEGGAAAKEAAKEGQPEGEEVEEAPAPGSYVTRCILVAIEQNVFRPVEQVVRISDGADALDRPKFREIVTYREAMGQRVILRDRKNRLHYHWLEQRTAAPAHPEKGEKSK